MLKLLARNWWALVLRGAVAVLFGIAALIWPDITVTALVFLFGAYVLVDGIFALIGAFWNRTGQWWLLLIEGIAGIAAGILTFIWPNITELILLYLIAFWAILTGILEIAAAIQLRKELTGEWLLVLGGLASLVFGIIMVFSPGAGATALIWLVGAYAIVFGVLLVVLGFKLRSWYTSRPSAPGQMA
jgi:uncharacterized membrane protein HdeD (DUF308 family)